MIDIGVNLLHPQFNSDRQAVIQRAREAGVSQMLITSTDLESSEAAIAYCQGSLPQGTTGGEMFCTAGVHPHDAKDAPLDLAERLASIAGSEPVKAIGETGLDFNRNYSPAEIQKQVFDTQLKLACRCELPVFVHDRDSDGAVYKALAAHAPELKGMVVHCFT